MNPYTVAKCIGPCLLSFINVKSSVAKLFNEKTRDFSEHPDPTKPLDHEIIEAYEVLLPNGEMQYVLTGFHKAEWSEWHIQCAGFKLHWEGELGNAWFVNWRSE